MAGSGRMIYFNQNAADLLGLLMRSRNMGASEIVRLALESYAQKLRLVAQQTEAVPPPPDEEG